MTKLILNLVFCIILLFGLFIDLNLANNNNNELIDKENNQPVIEKPKDVKIFVTGDVKQIDAKDVPKDVVIAKPIEIENKLESESETKSLNPILPIFPNLFDIFNNLNQQPQQEQQDSQKEPENKGILSILLMKSRPVEEDLKSSSSLNQQQSESESNSPIRQSLFIFRYFPQQLFSDDSNTNINSNNDHNGNKILLGSGGENDPDMIRFKLDHPSMMMTGQDDLNINNHFLSMHSMMDKFRNLFDFSQQQQDSIEEQDGNNNLNDDDDEYIKDGMPMIIKTDNGDKVIIANEHGQGNLFKSTKECMMMSLMKFKRSAYFRTFIHMLFFSALILFIMSMILITFRAFRKRRYSTLKYKAHKMDVSSIDSDLVNSKFGSIKSWYAITSDRSSLIDNNQSNLTNKLNAPPAYQQVLVKNNNNNNDYDDDDQETKSIPPEYEIVLNETKKQQKNN